MTDLASAAGVAADGSVIEADFGVCTLLLIRAFGCCWLLMMFALLLRAATLTLAPVKAFLLIGGDDIEAAAGFAGLLPVDGWLTFSTFSKSSSEVGSFRLAAGVDVFLKETVVWAGTSVTEAILRVSLLTGSQHGTGIVT